MGHRWAPSRGACMLGPAVRLEKPGAARRRWTEREDKSPSLSFSV